MRLNRAQIKQARKSGKSGMPVAFHAKRRRLNHDEKTTPPVRSIVASLEVIGGEKKAHSKNKAEQQNHDSWDPIPARKERWYI